MIRPIRLAKLNQRFWSVSVSLRLFPVINLFMLVCRLSSVSNQQTLQRTFATVSLAER
jgi:hypothetical protein